MLSKFIETETAAFYGRGDVIKTAASRKKEIEMVCLSRIIVLHLSDWTLTEFVENSSGSKTVGFFSFKQN